MGIVPVIIIIVVTLVACLYREREYGQQQRVAELRNALKYINNTAPPMYEYNDVEYSIIMTARKALESTE